MAISLWPILIYISSVQLLLPWYDMNFLCNREAGILGLAPEAWPLV
jgi:hypothetical protein